tara:strand:+ start:439 stop:678 length:240 start_codon:yes stop_codon:yes gene_type:complete
MIHRLPPIDKDPEIGDLCRLGGPGSMPRKYYAKHGIGIVVKKHRKNPDTPYHYEIKWLKSDEHMRFFKEDLIIVSNVDR